MMDTPEILSAAVKVHLTVQRKHDTYLLHFSFDGTVDVACDRCLDPLPLPVSTDWDLKVTYGDDFDWSSDDSITIPEEETSLDVAPMLRDTILLALPMRRVHPEGGCNTDMAATLREHSSSDPAEDDGATDDDDEES